MQTALSYDDVLLRPEHSLINSRLDVDISTSIIKSSNNFNLNIRVPIISSPMDTITEAKMAIAMHKEGGHGILHRFMSVEDQILNIKQVVEQNIIVSFAIGASDNSYDDLEKILFNIPIENIGFVLIDIANGYSEIAKRAINRIKYNFPHLPVMAGNVATADGFCFLADLGVDSVRVGIGGGSICSTRIQTGCGIPTLQSLLEIKPLKSKYPYTTVIADGGIKQPNHLVKAIVAGADAIMAGGIFAGCDETPGNIIYDNIGHLAKEYRGMASQKAQINYSGNMRNGITHEGTSTLVPYRKDGLKQTINNFAGGLRSAMTYLNANSIKELQTKDHLFMQITKAGLDESHSYGTR